MNTPSKEALDAAENVQDYLGFPRRATMDLAAIIDRHFEPLRQRLAEMESMLASEKTTRNAIIAKGQQTEARVKELEVSNSELRESHAAIHLALATLEADCSKWPDQIRALRAANADLTQSNAELAEAMRDKLLRIANNETARVDKAEARVKELEATCAELVTDGNALTLAANLAKQSQRAEQAEARVKELQKQEAESRRLFYAEQDKRQSAEQRNAELEKQNELLICDRARFPDKSCEVGNIIAAHIENLKAVSDSNAEAWRWACVRENALKERNDELVAALRDLHWYPADNDVHKHAAEVLARHAAGEPAKHPDAVTEAGLTGIKFRDAKSGREVMLITEGEWRDWIACKRPDGLWVSMRVATEQDRAAIDAARKEVQP